MGQSKGSYKQTPALTDQQTTLLNQILSSVMPLINQSSQAYSQFLPGGSGLESFKNQAMRDYQQTTIPSILNAFGTGSKGGSALNQALASSASNLNTNLATQLAQLQLQASQFPLNLAGLGLSTPAFAFEPTQGSTSRWGNAAKGAAAGGAAGSGAGPYGAAAGAALGGLGGYFGS